MSRQYSLDGTKLYDLQEQWIRENVGDDAADHANYGWGVDYVDEIISTKVYGENGGVLTTDRFGSHTWEPW